MPKLTPTQRFRLKPDPGTVVVVITLCLFILPITNTIKQYIDLQSWVLAILCAGAGFVVNLWKVVNTQGHLIELQQIELGTQEKENNKKIIALEQEINQLKVQYSTMAKLDKVTEKLIGLENQLTKIRENNCDSTR